MNQSWLPDTSQHLLGQLGLGRERDGLRPFCAARGLDEKRFFTWRRNLGLSPVAASPAAARPTPGFVPVRVIPDTTAEVTRPGGVTVRVPVAADPDAVARLVAALRGATC